MSSLFVRNVCKHGMAGLVAASVLLAAGMAVGDDAERKGGANSGRPAPRHNRPRPSRSTLRVGQEAPDFNLVRLDTLSSASEEGKSTASNKVSRIALSDYRGKRPVVLIFSSYT